MQHKNLRGRPELRYRFVKYPKEQLTVREFAIREKLSVLYVREKVYRRDARVVIVKEPR